MFRALLLAPVLLSGCMTTTRAQLARAAAQDAGGADSPVCVENYVTRGDASATVRLRDKAGKERRMVVECLVLGFFCEARDADPVCIDID